MIAVRPSIDPATLRRSYESGELTESTLADSWLAQLQAWYDEAAGDPRIGEPNAMQVATVDEAGRPDVRTVLARGFDARGVVFYTNYTSAKGRQLAEHPAAAALFAWLPAERQVRLRGPVSKVSRAETEAYFASRPRGSQLATWASPQSEVLADRRELDELLAEVTAWFGDGPIPPPPHWGGYRIEVVEAEFWQGRQFRLHDRLRFRQVPADGTVAADGTVPADGTVGAGWLVERLAP